MNKHPLVAVGPSSIHGQGLFALQDIPWDVNIIQYSGEHINDAEANDCSYVPTLEEIIETIGEEFVCVRNWSVSRKDTTTHLKSTTIEIGGWADRLPELHAPPKLLGTLVVYSAFTPAGIGGLFSSRTALRHSFVCNYQ